MTQGCYCGRCSGCRAAWEAGEQPETEEEARKRERREALRWMDEDPWAWNHFGPEPGDAEDEYGF